MLWLIQSFLEDWAIGMARERMMGWGGMGDKHSTGASSVSYGHNFLVGNVLEGFDCPESI